MLSSCRYFIVMKQQKLQRAALVLCQSRQVHRAVCSRVASGHGNKMQLVIAATTTVMIMMMTQMMMIMMLKQSPVTCS